MWGGNQRSFDAGPKVCSLAADAASSPSLVSFARKPVHEAKTVAPFLDSVNQRFEQRFLRDEH
jgi:hypothetical protein